MINMLKLLHYKNSLMFSEIVSCSAIMLKYKGKFIGESQLSDDWYIGTGKNKIICTSFAGDQEVSELFTFTGSFQIVGMKVITKELEDIYALYDKMDIDYFNLSRESFENGGSYFSDYNSTHSSIRTIEDTDIYKNNLFTKQDEFYHENGENYFGDYHQHSNGQAMTESEHNKDSVNIYRKTKNNKLYKPKPKRLKKITLKEEMTPQRDEDRVSVSVKSEADRIRGGQGAGSSGGGGSGGY